MEPEVKPVSDELPAETEDMSRDPSASETISLLIKALRPRQWTKNLIIFAPLLFAMKATDPGLLFKAFACALSFCAVSGGIYIVNDVADRESDKLHPKKKSRPIASGRLKVSAAVPFAIVCISGGLVASFLIRPSLLLVLLVYLLMNLAYGYKLKQYALIDVFMIAAGFVLRAVAGAVAVSVPASGWFLMCTTFGALFLALEKRRSELAVLGDKSETHRKSLSTYSQALLNRLEGIVAPCLLTSYAFYSFLSQHGQWMMLTVPFVLYGVMRYQQLSMEGTITGSPEEVLLKDRPIQIAILLWLLTCVLVIYGLHDFLSAFVARFDSLKVAP